jgi:hypothetical protein
MATMVTQTELSEPNRWLKSNRTEPNWTFTPNRPNRTINSNKIRTDPNLFPKQPLGIEPNRLFHVSMQTHMKALIVSISHEICLQGTHQASFLRMLFANINACAYINANLHANRVHQWVSVAVYMGCGLSGVLRVAWRKHVWCYLHKLRLASSYSFYVFVAPVKDFNCFEITTPVVL